MKFYHKISKFKHFLLLFMTNLKLIALASSSISAKGNGNGNLDLPKLWNFVPDSKASKQNPNPDEWLAGVEDIFVEEKGDGLEIEDEPPPPKYDNRIKPSYTHSPTSMKKLALVEEYIYEEMKIYVSKMEIRMNLMKNYMKDYEESSIKGRAHLENDKEREHEIVAHPFISHRMLRRFAFDFVNIADSFQDFSDEQFLEVIGEISDLNEQLVFPNMTDYGQSLEAISRIQRYTHLDTEEFANGKLGDLETNVSLRSYHAFEIAYNAKISHQLAMQIEWLELALKKLDEEEEPNENFRTEILDALKEAVLQHDANWEMWQVVNDLCFAEKVGSNFGSRIPKREKMTTVMQKSSIPLRNKTEYGSYTKSNFMTLCSGANIQTEQEKSRLKCWYETKKNPYWRINPLKMELLNEEPPLLQIYDLLDPKRIQWIIDIATPTLIRSAVINVENPNLSDVTNVRTSSQTWLEDSRYTYFETLMKNIELITGLRVRGPSASELFQVATYGSSHHYDEHLDTLMDNRRTELNGDRMGTFMFYLTDIKVGGKTSFPVMGTAANPVAGSAVFWHNLKLNGQPDKRTWHGGCPVVHGVKWVANKWILSHDNWNNRKCSLDPNE